LKGSAHLKVGLILEPPGIDDPYLHGAYVGMERAVRELGITGRVLTPAPKEGYVPSLTLFAQQGYDLVIAFPGVFGGDHRPLDTGLVTAGDLPAAAVEAVALRFPATRFAVIDVAHDALAHRPPNVQSIVFGEEQAGFLAGYLAALVLTLSPGENVISSIGGEPIPAVERYIAGYEAGARLFDPSITILTGYTDNFYDRLKGRSVALGQIARGSRVLFQVAGYCGLGALEAATEQKVWGIGVDVDQSELGPHILTSAVKRIDVAVFATIERLAHGALETGGTSRFPLEEGGVGLGAINDQVPPSMVAQLEELEADIVAGKLTIPVK
jgi:basic membrane protein A and related proteins